MQLVLIEDKVEQLFKALRTDERRVKCKGKAEKNSLVSHLQANHGKPVAEEILSKIHMNICFI